MKTLEEDWCAREWCEVVLDLIQQGPRRIGELRHLTGDTHEEVYAALDALLVRRLIHAVPREGRLADPLYSAGKRPRTTPRARRPLFGGEEQ